ncbi:alpha-ribazole phosphatase family protein [Cupriavidus sp. RAF12]|uniref:alpha-ribazole phosphatase family protein n=1 Tax=Cupriavidus sp. RAF12 TaxID=3233050 RepID=UPI003F8E999D
MELVLIRHARPEVAPNICYGILDLALAMPVSPAPARIVSTLHGLWPDRIITSPAARARETAAQLVRWLDSIEPDKAGSLACEVQPRLRELDFGEWEGRHWDTIPSADLDDWAANLMEARPHGGESAAQVMARVVEWADSLPAGQDGQERCLWVVTHAGPMRMLAAHWLGLTLAQTMQWELAFGATCHFRLGDPRGAGTARLGWWNRLAD